MEQLRDITGGLFQNVEISEILWEMLKDNVLNK